MKTNKYKNFQDWWDKFAQKKVSKIEKQWLKNNKPNDPDEEDGGDYWHVNQMMFDGEAHSMTYENSEEVFEKGLNGEEWEMDMSYSLFCDLDDIINEAYQAGKSLNNN